MTKRTIDQLRKDYQRGALDEEHCASEPFAQFGRWFDEAMHAELPEPNAMTLATADAAGTPSARVVLLKGFDLRGFVFFTNYLSRKGRELTENPKAALLFFWPELERQVRLEGAVAQLEAAESDAYYASRPLPSRLGAWASPQSQPISGKAWLVAKVAEVGLQHGLHPPRPPHWGGFLLRPHAVEFWQGRPSRLHDRIRYELSVDGTWRLDRLAP